MEGSQPVEEDAMEDAEGDMGRETPGVDVVVPPVGSEESGEEVEMDTVALAFLGRGAATDVEAIELEEDG